MPLLCSAVDVIAVTNGFSSLLLSVSTSLLIWPLPLEYIFLPLKFGFDYMPFFGQKNVIRQSSTQIRVPHVLRHSRVPVIATGRIYLGYLQGPGGGWVGRIDQN